MIRNEVLSAYNQTKSIKETARKLGHSESTVRKILVSEGVVSTPLSERIKELRAAGMPQKDIAELLKVSESCVSANAPYQRGSYLDKNKSRNAIAIKRCRQKKNSAT